jgi:hypothetical protein
MEVDLTDPDALAERVNELDDRVVEKYVAVNELAAQLKEAQDELAYWIGLRNRVGALAGVAQTSQRDQIEAAITAAGPLTLQDQTEAVVNSLGVPVRAADVMRHLPPGTKRERVNWALWKAAQDGRIQRQAPGVYAPTAFARIEAFRDKFVAANKARAQSKGT